jgi:hypothetical protein
MQSAAIPDGVSIDGENAAMVARACRLIEQSEEDARCRMREERALWTSSKTPNLQTSGAPPAINLKIDLPTIVLENLARRCGKFDGP